MKVFKKIDKVIDGFSLALAIVTAIALVFIMAVIVIDCIMRFAANASISGAYELVQVAMALVVFFAFAYAQRTHALVHVTFFMRKLPGKMPLIMWALTSGCSAFISVLLTYASYQQVFIIQKINSTTTIMFIPLYPFYAFMTFAFAAFSLTLIYDFLKSALAVFNREMSVEVIENWPS